MAVTCAHLSRPSSDEATRREVPCRVTLLRPNNSTRRIGQSLSDSSSSYVNVCSYTRQDCDGTLLRTSRVNSSDQVMDTVLYTREAVSASATLNPNRSWPVRGSGAIACYSGLQRSYGEARDRVLSNHVQLVFGPLTRLFSPRNVFVAFSAGEPEPLPSLVHPRVIQILSDEIGIAPSHFIAERRDYGGHVVPVTSRGGQNDTVVTQ